MPQYGCNTQDHDAASMYESWQGHGFSKWKEESIRGVQRACPHDPRGAEELWLGGKQVPYHAHDSER